MIPAGYVEFCTAAGLNPYHPERWTSTEQATFRAWRLRWFRVKWRWLRDVGDVALRLRTDRARLLADVRADRDRALGPAPVRAWKTCPCHQQRFYTSAITASPEEAIDDEDVAAWRAQDRAHRQELSARLARALAYLDTFKPKEPDHERRRSTVAGPPPGAVRSYWPEEAVGERAGLPRRAARADRGRAAEVPER